MERVQPAHDSEVCLVRGYLEGHPLGHRRTDRRPALDSQVQARLGIKPPTSSIEWLATLGQVANDIAAFEARSGPLADAGPERFRHLNVGRLYDMALGPREPGS